MKILPNITLYSVFEVNMSGYDVGYEYNLPKSKADELVEKLNKLFGNELYIKYYMRKDEDN